MPLRGAFRYSQRSGHLQTRFAQTMQVPSSERCSVAQHGLMAGGYLSARPLRELRPNGLFASLTSRGWGCLISHASLLTRARHAVPLHLTPPSSHLTLRATTRVAPTPSILALPPPTSLLTPHPSPLTPHSSLLTPHSSLLRPHSSLLTPTTSLLQPHPSPISFHPKKAQTSARWVCVSA